VHPAVRSAFDLRERVYLLALDFDRVIALAGRQTPYEPLPKFPPVMQDLAVVVDATVPAAKVEEAIWHGGGKLLRSLAFFDRYQGDPIPAGKVSLAYTLTFQAADRTLTDEEVAAARKKIVGRLAAEVGGVLR
jgi:phenylalanyl-tRNA synthetase beta chain